MAEGGIKALKKASDLRRDTRSSPRPRSAAPLTWGQQRPCSPGASRTRASRNAQHHHLDPTTSGTESTTSPKLQSLQPEGEAKGRLLWPRGPPSITGGNGAFEGPEIGFRPLGLAVSSAPAELAAV